MKLASETRVPARERILDAATRLFYERGIARTGIDLIIDEAGIAKASLYNSFSSKNDLVATYLEVFREKWMAQVTVHRDRHGFRVATLFDVLAESVDSGRFHGCPFLNALSEMPDDPGVIREVAAYRSQVRNFFSQFLDMSVSREVEDNIVDTLALVHDGAYMACKAERSSRPAQLASVLAQKIVDNASKERSR
jgi:AcrR family transcriptional regulator